MYTSLSGDVTGSGNLIETMKAMFDDEFVYMNTVRFDIGRFYVEYEMYAPKAHLRKGSLRPHSYHYYHSITTW